MPNPIAHPAAAVPFTKVGLVFSALVIGSVSPDFGYLIPLPTAYFMYTVPGLVLFDVPVGFVLLWLFHALVKWPLLSALPENLQRRLFKPAQGFSFGPLKRFGLILLSLLAGSITHVVWDSFTHDYGWMVEQFAVLSIPVGGTPLYAILQNLSTLVGIGLLAYWFLRWLPTAHQSDELPRRFSGKVLTLFLVPGAITLAAVEGGIIYSRLMGGSGLVRGHFLIGSIIVSAGFIISFFVGAYCLAWTTAFYKTIRRAG